MIKVEYDAKIENGGINAKLNYSHKKSCTLEIEFLIAHLIDLIKENDSNMKDGQIIKDIRTILKEINNEKRGEK